MKFNYLCALMMLLTCFETPLNIIIQLSISEDERPLSNCYILSMRTAYRHILALRTANCLTKTHVTFWRFHLLKQDKNYNYVVARRGTKHSSKRLFLLRLPNIFH